MGQVVQCQDVSPISPSKSIGYEFWYKKPVYSEALCAPAKFKKFNAVFFKSKSNVITLAVTTAILQLR